MLMNRLDYNREDVEVYRQEVLKHIVPLVEYIFTIVKANTRHPNQ